MPHRQAPLGTASENFKTNVFVKRLKRAANENGLSLGACIRARIETKPGRLAQEQEPALRGYGTVSLRNTACTRPQALR